MDIGLLLGAIGLGTIFGAVITGGADVYINHINNKKEAENEKKQLHGQLTGQKHLIVQTYVSYFSSFIPTEHFVCRSTIHAIHAVDFESLNKMPQDRARREFKRVSNEARENTVEFKRIPIELQRSTELQMTLGKNNESLWITIGSIRTSFPRTQELDYLINQITITMNSYELFENSVKNRFRFFMRQIEDQARDMILVATSRRFEPNQLRDDLFFRWIDEINILVGELEDELEARTVAHYSSIDNLLYYLEAEIYKPEIAHEYVY